jgi:hypothetical protein
MCKSDKVTTFTGRLSGNNGSLNLLSRSVQGDFTLTFTRIRYFTNLVVGTTSLSLARSQIIVEYFSYLHFRYVSSQYTRRYVTFLFLQLLKINSTINNI